METPQDAILLSEPIGEASCAIDRVEESNHRRVRRRSFIVVAAISAPPAKVLLDLNAANTQEGNRV